MMIGGFPKKDTQFAKGQGFKEAVTTALGLFTI